jgi:hypothetical protein
VILETHAGLSHFSPGACLQHPAGWILKARPNRPQLFPRAPTSPRRSQPIMKRAHLLTILLTANVLLATALFGYFRPDPSSLRLNSSTNPAHAPTAAKEGFLSETSSSLSQTRAASVSGTPTNESGQAPLSSSRETFFQPLAPVPSNSGQQQSAVQSRPSIQDGAASSALTTTAAPRTGEPEATTLGPDPSSPGAAAGADAPSESLQEFSPARTLTSEVVSTAPGNYVISNGQRVAVESTGPSPEGNPNKQLNVVITPEPSASEAPASGKVPMANSTLPDSGASANELFTHDQELFRAKWGWAAYDQARRTAWEPVN